MAGLAKRKKKTGTAYSVSFRLEGKRRSVFLPASYSLTLAEDVRRIIERCVDAIETGTRLDRQTFAWIANASSDLRERFASVGLIRSDVRMTLRQLFDAYAQAEYPSFKENTIRNKMQTERRFFELVAPNIPIDEFRPSDARRFVADVSVIYCEATRAGIVKDAKRVFSWGVSRELLEKNPFDGIPKGSFKNKSREFFISRDDYARLLDASPSLEFRVLLALYRIGGLRKNEALAVEWRDVDFIRSRLLVHSPKTERYAGKESRIIPLFPELREELERLYESLPEGAPTFVIFHNRTAITQKLERVVFLAGLTRWERLIQNLRSSRAIEVYNDFGALAESEWIGHSSQTAKDHYLHLLDADFERAVTRVTM